MQSREQRLLRAKKSRRPTRGAVLEAKDAEIASLKARIASLEQAAKIKSLGAAMGAETRLRNEFGEKIQKTMEAHEAEIERLKAEHKEHLEYVDTLIPRRSDRVSLARIEESAAPSPARAPMSPIDPNSGSKPGRRSGKGNEASFGRS